MLDLHQNGSSKGHLILFDMEGFPRAFVPKISTLTFKKYFHYMQEIMPIMELKGFHFVNVVPFMDEIQIAFEPGLPKSLLSRVRTLINLLTKYLITL